MAISLVINNVEDLIKGISKAIIFSGVTLFLILCALISAVLIACHTFEDEFNDVVPFLLLTTPFILHGLQMVTTISILYSVQRNSQSVNMRKCRLWSVTTRILTAPILIEMMILIGFKWYLTIIAIPLVLMYFVTMLQVEKIIHYFFTRNLSARIHQNRRTELAILWGGGQMHINPYDLDLGDSHYPNLHSLRCSARRGPPSHHLAVLSLNVPIPIPPPTYSEAVGENLNENPNPNSNSLHLTLNPENESPPPAYREAIKKIGDILLVVPEIKNDNENDKSESES